MDHHEARTPLQVQIISRERQNNRDKDPHSSCNTLILLIFIQTALHVNGKRASVKYCRSGFSDGLTQTLHEVSLVVVCSSGYWKLE
jgi:hypothetical protein